MGLGMVTKSEIFATLAWLFGIVGAVIVLIKRRDDEFAVFHARQSLILNLFLSVALIFLELLVIQFRGYYSIFWDRISETVYLFFLAPFIVTAIMGTLLALKGKRYKFPLLYRTSSILVSFNFGEYPDLIFLLCGFASTIVVWKIGSWVLPQYPSFMNYPRQPEPLLPIVVPAGKYGYLANSLFFLGTMVAPSISVIIFSYIIPKGFRMPWNRAREVGSCIFLLLFGYLLNFYIIFYPVSVLMILYYYAIALSHKGLGFFVYKAALFGSATIASLYATRRMKNTLTKAVLIVLMTIVISYVAFVHWLVLPAT